MKLTIASIAPRRTKSKTEALDHLAADYIQRSSRYTPTESLLFPSEVSFFDGIARSSTTRTMAHLILLDSRGQSLSSEEFAQYIGRVRDSGVQRIVLAVGSADGWTDAGRQRADFLLSFGRITLPHELARVILSEQLYRALTILAGHPYHSGH